MRTILASCICLLLWGAGAHAAENVDIRFCNRSGLDPLYFVFAYTDGATGEMTVNGYFLVANNQCGHTIKSIASYAQSQLYYHIQFGGKDGTDEPDAEFGVGLKAFIRRASEPCPPENCRRAKFKKVIFKKGEPVLLNITQL